MSSSGAGGPIIAVLLGVALFLAPFAPGLLGNRRPMVQLRLLDVGQGQSVLVEWSGLGGERPEGRLLIDGGGLGSEYFDVGKAVLAPVLTDNRLPCVYAVINSHPDRDHLEGLLYILEHFQVERYYGNGDEPSSGLAAKAARIHARGAPDMERLVKGDSVALAPGLLLEVLWPGGDVSAGNENTQASGQGGRTQQDRDNRNDNSLVLRLVWKGKGLAVIPGDVGKKPLAALARATQPEMSAQVLVLPHHGSGKSLAPAFYAKVGARLALASCGATNAWRYPAASVRQALESNGTKLHSTAERGQIAVRWTTPAQAQTSFALP